MPHVLHTIWLDSHEPTNKDTLWIKPLKKDYYGIFVYGSNGWVLTTAMFKGTIGEFVIDQLPEATTETNGVMAAQDKRDLEMLKDALANIDVIIEAINNIDQTPTEGSQHMVTSGGVHESLKGKVDVVDGKGLSTEDFTSEEKNKLASIPDDIINGIQSDWNTNNNDSVSYIKNRTHWEENGVVHKLHPKFLDMDTTPTSGSTKPVMSGGVKEALDGKQDVIRDLADIRQGAGLGETAYQKPSAGIPASDLAAGVIPDVSGFITRTVNDLANYYLKSETYTKEEVAALIGAIKQFHYEVYAALPATGEGNVLYLIGPTGSGSDKYEEYVYANSTWTKIGDTSIDLSNYVTTTALNTALADYTTTANLTTLLAGKQDALVSGTNIKTINGESLLGSGDIEVAAESIDTVEVSVDSNTGTPSASAAISGSTLTLAFHNIKGDEGKQGPQGNTGSSVDYPYELVNNLTTDDATKGLSAAQGVVLDGKVSQLRQEVRNIFQQTNDDGMHFVDEQLNVAMKYDNDGLDVAKVSDHFKSLLGGGGDFIQVTQDGVFFVDESLNIGVYIDANGIHANNILEYQIINI